MAINTSSSRFAVLKIEDDLDDDAKADKKNLNANLQKKKNKKKKKPDQQKGEVSEAQWEEWKKHDSENVDKCYEQDLQLAILQSRIDYESKKANSVPMNGSGEQNIKQENEKQKKKKDKPQAMTLQQFNQLPQQTESESSNGPDNRHAAPKPSAKVQESDTQFFDRVTEDAGRIVQKEKLQEEYQKQYLVESARTRQHREELEKKDSQINELQDKNLKLEEELKVVKKRNQQLCHILAQGEMKDKTEVLTELAELTKVRDELTSEVQRLTMELEREKSQNHKVKAELDKLKGGKHVK